MDYPANQRICHPEFARESPLRCAAGGIFGPNRSHLIFGKFRLPMSFAVSSPAFAHAICSIVGMRSDKQVTRSKADPVIAVVANKEAVRYWAKREFVRRAVYAPQLWTCAQTPVAVGSFSARPLQAWVRVPRNREIVRKFCQFLLQVVKIGRIVAHCAALLRPCFAGAVVVHATRPHCLYRTPRNSI